MLSSFSVGTGDSVTIPIGYTFIMLSHSLDHSSTVVFVLYGTDSPSQYDVAPGDLYYLCSNGNNIVSFENEFGGLFTLMDTNDIDS